MKVIWLNRAELSLRRTKDNEILISAFWDCRREPKKLIKDIS